MFIPLIQGERERGESLLSLALKHNITVSEVVFLLYGGWVKYTRKERQVKQYWDNGYSIKSIATKLQCPTTEIKQILSQKYHITKHSITLTRNIQILNDYKKNRESYRVLAARYGVSKDTVRNIIKEKFNERSRTV